MEFVVRAPKDEEAPVRCKVVEVAAVESQVVGRREQIVLVEWVTVYQLHDAFQLWPLLPEVIEEIQVRHRQQLN